MSVAYHYSVLAILSHESVNFISYQDQ